MSSDLRTTLDRAAADADVGAPNMAAIRGRGRQRTVRRRTAVGVVTVPVLAAAMFLLAPGRSDDVTQRPIPPAAQVSTTQPTPGKSAGRVLAYVDKVTSQEIVYDKARWIDGCLDGFSWLPGDESDGVGSGGDQAGGEKFYPVEELCVRNDKHKAVVSPVAPDVVVISAAGTEPSAQQTITWLGEFGATPDANHWFYWLTLDHGVVTKIEQVNPTTP
jgi:hypothetical protein